MISMGLPDDQAVLAAVGKIALRHGQLDYILRMTVKTLTSATIPEALDATARQGSYDLRKRIRKLAQKRIGECDALVRLDAILERVSRATKRRNELLHGLWAYELDGNPVMRVEGIEFNAIPTAAELEAVADTLDQIRKELNLARLDGFLKAALEN